ncbi:GNAT family N-acetyltransferase [Nocardioides cynanchi]|uniref:GNAT family N-acetyltransferase n=1 Tax=Nocardioides cynanchi TaxID=2558918 RepID=UPI00192DF2ED|nr:GNAT family N-acetyltransferase [Nocardioides cynanchi]
MARTPLGSPVPRAVAVVVRGHKVLVIRRRLDGREYAVLPGGGIEQGETAAQAAVRELAEECTLEGTVLRHLFDGDHGGRTASYFLVDVAEGEPVLGGAEAEEQDPENTFQPLWATAPELELLDLLPEEIRPLLVQAAWPLTVTEAGAADRPVVEALWQLYQHDLSEFRHSAPGPDGRFDAGRLRSYADRPDRAAYVARLGDVPCGFALVRGLADGRTRRMGEFFVTRSARRRGVAAELARSVVSAHPGPWEIPFQDENPRAAAFWRRFAAETMTGVSERRVPVPGKPHLPPDVWLAGAVATDWVDWHAPYADPASALSRRLAIVQSHVVRVLDETSPRPVRVLSICAGDGRDLLGVLAGRPDADRVIATLVELDPDLCDRARSAAAVAGLTGIDVRTGDAGDPTTYAGVGAADLVLASGIFGNVPDDDVRRTIGRLPAVSAPGATVVWTRHRNPPDLTPAIRGWFRDGGFEEVAFEAPADVAFSVGVHRWTGAEGDGELGGERLFTFFR